MPNQIHIRRKSDFLDNQAQVPLGCRFRKRLGDKVASRSQRIHIHSALGQIKKHDR